ncbi:membrane-associated protein, putative [Bodo saltans]|uniref:Membrane-associated protein, putative n=1 Tax=Bodo saltans TaxID=75058 RepID=A0A0S4KKE0_BODSA|nr:membrane-associated protein, putative [Bodo saltans]|eukprot:CUI15058.1 membrane-associated protein, putative [Bodo saltans]
MLLCSVTTTVTGAILNVCISSTALAPNIQTLSDCLNYTGAQVIASAAATSSATTSSNLRALQFNTTQSKVLTYTLTNWAQAVLLAFVRSQSTRTRMYVQLTTASVANNQISIVNTTTGSWWVLDYGAAMMTDGTSTGQTDQIQISGYLSTVAQTQSMMFGSTSLIKSPAYGEMSTVVNAQAQQAALAFVTYPSSGSYAFFGAVYPVPQTSLTASQIVSITSEALQNRPSQNQKNNLHFQMLAGIAANGSLVNFSFYRTTYTDLAISDTPVPTTLAGGVTQAPITDSVIGWYIYLVIGIGVVAAIGFFIFLAKKARLKKEDKKKTAKRRKKEEDKFNKMASDLRSGIKHDDEEDHRELESGGEDKNYY